jgi:hypothetical protein
MTNLEDFANGRINNFKNSLDVYQKKISVLSAKGVDVSSLNQIISDANTQIIAPLQSAISSAGDASSLNQAIKKYCLFDGCVNGTNFHLAAKFETAKLQIALNKINSSSEATQLQTDLTNAKNILTQVGTSQYTSDQNKNLWNAISNGYKVIKSILNSNKLSGQATANTTQ